MNFGGSLGLRYHTPHRKKQAPQRGNSILHVENRKSPRGYFLFSTWAWKNSSDLSFDSSEVLFLAYVGNVLFLRGDFQFSSELFENPHLGITALLRIPSSSAS